MALQIVMVFEGVGVDQYWGVNEKLGIGQDGGAYPDGLLVHVCSPTETGLLISEVWDSPASHEAFLAGRLGAALAAVGVEPPAQVIAGETVNVQLLG